MSVFRSFLLVCLISFSAAFGLFYLGSKMGYEEFRGGYAVLTADVSIDDKKLRSLLETNEGFFEGELFSESSQWVMLDEFDSLQMIPLDLYYSRIFSFDLRNDGYADKLKNIFIKDGKRFIYIPLKAGNWNSYLLDKQFEELLGEMPFSVDYYGIGRPLNLFFISYAAASLVFLIICFVKLKHNRGITGIIALIPVFFSLAFFGAEGIGCVALLFAFFVMLKDPLYELITPAGKINKKRFIKEIVLPYKIYWLLLPFFIAAFIIIVFFSQLKLLFFLIVSVAGITVFLLTIKISSVSYREHKRFTPILIMRQRFPEITFPVYMLPFAAAAFFVMYFTPYMSAAYDSNKKFDILIDEQDYYKHLNYQSSFSVRRMGGQDFQFISFPSFFIDTDGLPSMEIRPSVNHAVDISDFPPFPLKNLMDFFHDVNSGQRKDITTSTGLITNKLSLLVLLPFLIIGLFIKKKNENLSKIKLDRLKRINIKQRQKGINWNKKPVYNSRNLSRIQKDA